MKGSVLPCRARTKKYCEDAVKDPGNKAKTCFCRVSYWICRFFIDPEKNGGGGIYNAQERGCLNCINKCLFDHYEKRFSGESSCWATAIDPSKNKCLYGGDPCNWYIRCEQKTLTGCLGKSCASACKGGVPKLPFNIFPLNGTEIERISTGQALCCDGDSPASSPALGVDPAHIITLLDELISRGQN
jgi:hypothetical protein